MDLVENIQIDVETDSFFSGSPGVLHVYLNGNGSYVPPTAFTWDGGSNHIELRGGLGSSATNSGWVELDNLIVRTR